MISWARLGRGLRPIGVVVAALLVLTVPGIGTLSPTARPPVGSEPAASTPPQPFHGNLAVADGSPPGTAQLGSSLSVSYRISLNRSSSAIGAGIVRVPGSVATFPVASGEVRVPVPSEVYNVSPLGTFLGTANVSLVLQSTESFNGSSNATFTSDGLAVMTSWPRGSVALGFQWRWSLHAVGRPPADGPWSGPATLLPDRVAWLEGDPPGRVILGGSYPVCLSGPIAGRSFAIHVAFANSSPPFVGVTAAAPATSASPFCWNTTLPSTVSQANGLVHLWELGSVAYLLYQYPVQFVNGSGGDLPPANASAGLGWTAWLLPAIAAGAVVLIAVDLSIWLRSRRRTASDPLEHNPGRLPSDQESASDGSRDPALAR
ncbi:MAG TPA: hypothetical protein VGV89_00885 [Thermoplasmata archaeon]|nr:hypothetical protein [Thermoplasmata archaeon]